MHSGRRQLCIFCCLLCFGKGETISFSMFFYLLKVWTTAFLNLLVPLEGWRLCKPQFSFFLRGECMQAKVCGGGFCICEAHWAQASSDIRSSHFRYTYPCFSWFVVPFWQHLQMQCSCLGSGSQRHHNSLKWCSQSLMHVLVSIGYPIMCRVTRSFLRASTMPR